MPRTLCENRYDYLSLGWITTVLLGGFNPSEKYEFVNWDDEIPNIYIYIWKVIKKNCSKPPTTSKMMIWWLWCKAAHGCPMRGPRASDTHCTSPWGSKQSLWMSQHRDSDGKWWKWEYSLKKNSPSQPLHLSIGIQNGSWWLKMLSHSLLPSGKRLHSYWSHGPVEIVDFPNYNMVDLSSSLRKRLPEGHHYPIGPWCWYVYIYIYVC